MEETLINKIYMALLNLPLMNYRLTKQKVEDLILNQENTHKFETTGRIIEGLRIIHSDPKLHHNNYNIVDLINNINNDFRKTNSGYIVDIIGIKYREISNEELDNSKVLYLKVIIKNYGE